MHPAPDLSVHINHREQIFVLTVRGEVDYDDAGGFERAWEAADRAAMPVTAVDLAEVTFADSVHHHGRPSQRRRRGSVMKEAVTATPGGRRQTRAHPLRQGSPRAPSGPSGPHAPAPKDP